MNTLKHHINPEKQAHRDNPSHTDVVSDDEEQEIPMHAVLVTQLPNVLPEDAPMLSGDPVMKPVATDLENVMHISTQVHPPVLAFPSATTQPPPATLAPTLSPLTVADWS